MRLGNFSSFTLPLHIHLCAPKKPMRTNGCGILAPSTRRKPPNPWRKWYSLTQYRLPDDLFAESQKAIGLEEKWETETVWRAPHHARDFKVFLGGGRSCGQWQIKKWVSKTRQSSPRRLDHFVCLSRSGKAFATKSIKVLRCKWSDSLPENVFRDDRYPSSETMKERKKDEFVDARGFKCYVAKICRCE